MKKLLKYTMLALLLTGFIACEEDTQVIEIIEGVERGAILRTLNDTDENGSLTLGAGGEYLIQVEEQDEQDGDLLESVDVFLSFADNTLLSDLSITGAGMDLSFPAEGDVLVKTIPASDFSDGPFGLPRADITINEAEIASVLPIADITSNDVVNVRLELNLTDGRSFTSVNANGDPGVNGNIAGGAFFLSPFAYQIPIDSGIGINYLAENNNTFVTLDGFDNTYFVQAEMTDQDGGANIAGLNVYKRFVDNTVEPGADDLSQTEVLLQSFTSGDFVTGPNGFPTVDVTITPMELLGALTADDVAIGDAFFVRYEVLTNDGRTITDEVEEGNFYDLVAATDCPFPPLDETMVDSFVGDYALTQLVPTIFGYETFSAPGNNVLTLFATETDASQVTPGFPLAVNQRSFDADYILALGFGNTLTYGIEFNLCEVTIFEGGGSISGGTGLTCGGPGIDLGPLEGGFYNASDDSEFILTFFDDVLDDCGTGGAMPQIMFTAL